VSEYFNSSRFPRSCLRFVWYNVLKSLCLISESDSLGQIACRFLDIWEFVGAIPTDSNSSWLSSVRMSLMSLVIFLVVTKVNVSDITRRMGGISCLYSTSVVCEKRQFRGIVTGVVSTRDYTSDESTAFREQSVCAKSQLVSSSQSAHKVGNPCGKRDCASLMCLHMCGNSVSNVQCAHFYSYRDHEQDVKATRFRSRFLIV